MESNKKESSRQKLAVITGADGGMGTEITRAVAQAGYRVIMASCRKQKAEAVRRTLLHDHRDLQIEVRKLDLASLASVAEFANILLEESYPITLLMNCAGTMETGLHITEDGLERTVSVNYVGPYLLTRKLLPLMHAGSRVVNMVSCTYAIGHLDFPDFFTRGRRGGFWRIPIYSNTKLALTLFTIDLAERVRDRGIVVNAADPGIVSTDIITMHMWFDPLTDLLFRPFIRTPRQGADTAIRLLLDEDAGQRTGTFNVSGHAKPLSEKYTRHVQMQELWQRTEKIVEQWL
ncbi:SDR family oxidoreductase [Bacteroides sp. ET71]|uniref:SDR family oxidoreductase n=1 Tax=Bacteroides sp. ET71 TaxID=2939421 RepID=UPI00201393DF|nr:SDR family oxidoreductase [Bacteroides sp. ET71]MCL1615893.1 SDR family oxidoreductase [Bacteroides sp. ET71]